MPQREGADPLVSAMFYPELVQTVLLLGAEMWVLLAAIVQYAGGGARGIPQTEEMKEG